MKRKDWINKEAQKYSLRGTVTLPSKVAKSLRAAERRGFARAVKLLRERDPYNEFQFSCLQMADWLEDNKDGT